MPDNTTPTQSLILPTLKCAHCGRFYQSRAYQSTYCTLRCKQAASTKRRRLRESAPEIFNNPQPVSQKELQRQTAIIMARNEGRELTSEDVPSEFQVALGEIGYTHKKPEKDK